MKQNTNLYKLNNKDLYKNVPHKLYVGKISDLGYMSEKEAVDYAIKKFKTAVSKINQELLGYDLNITE